MVDDVRIPSIPDVPVRLSETDIYNILDPLKRILDIRQGKFDINQRWATYQDLIDFGIIPQATTEQPIIIIPPTVQYNFLLEGDIEGGPTTMADGNDPIIMQTIINLPNVTGIDGGDAAETYPGSAQGPYGVAGSGGGGGVAHYASPWELLDATTISGSPSEQKITWDESLYSDIWIVIRGVQGASDGRTFLMTLGEDDGATMHTAAGDYDGVRLQWDNTTVYSNIPNSDELDLFNNTGSVAGEVVNGTIHIGGTFGTDIGAFVHSQIYAKDSSNNQRVVEIKGFLTGSAAAGAIDTFRLYFAAGGLFANVGSIEVYGLLIAVPDVGGGGGGGNGGGTDPTGWEKISETAITNIANIDITWDESLYREIHVVIEGAQPVTDSVDFRVRLGSDNGSTIHTGGTDYFNSRQSGGASSWSNGAVVNAWGMVSSSMGNDIDEFFSCSFTLRAFNGSVSGAMYDGNLMWHNASTASFSSKSQGVFKTAAVIDTVRLFLESGSFVATGTVTLYGLLK